LWFWFYYQATLQPIEMSLRFALPEIRKFLILIYGEESFLLDQALRTLIDKAISPEAKDFNFDSFLVSITILDKQSLICFFTLKNCYK
jgi:DNA polymerase III delta subunit